MKRRFTQKVKQVPTCAADSFEALLKLYLAKPPVGAANPTEVNRKARTSAAMIGLAISMGAGGLLLPQKGDEALAVEPVAAEPNSTSVPAASETSVSPAAAEPKVAAVSTPPVAVQQEQEAVVESKSTPAHVVEHRVQKGETLWELSKSYEVQPEAIAASNKIKPSATLPVGQKLKIPQVNGIVHEVKAGESVEALSKSYGVEPTQLQVSAPVSESGQLKTGESVTVPGNVNDLLKARQDVALNRLKEKRDRLNDSLAELRSEESTNLSELKTAPKSDASAAERVPLVTLSPEVLKPGGLVASAPQLGNAPSNPVVIPVPTPEMAATPVIQPKAGGQQASPVMIPVPTPELAATPVIELNAVKRPASSVVLPIPTPQIAATPVIQPKVAGQQGSSVVLPVPTPQIAATPVIELNAVKRPASSVVLPVPTPQIAATPVIQPKVAGQQASPVVIPVPTPEMAATPVIEPKAATVPNLAINSVTNSETAAKPQVLQPVVIETLVGGRPANVYQVKPGDTLEAIANRYGLSRVELARTNQLSNPNRLRINQQLRIPQSQPGSVAQESVTLLPGINSKTGSSPLGQEQRGVTAPTLGVPTQSDRVTPVVPTEQASQRQSVLRPVLAQSTVEGDEQANATVVADNKPSQPANSQSNPYVEQLRADILKLREEYRQNRERGQASESRNVAVPSVTMPVAPSLNNASTPTRINPEFNPNRNNETLQAELKRRPQQQPAQHGPIQIEVPPPETASLGAPQDLLATAPAPAENYNRMIRTPVGETVSPELPSLSAPDTYLPDSPGQINGYIWPAKGVLTSGYGRRWGRMHRGIDIAASIGTPIFAVAPGVIVSAGWNSGGYGNLVEIQHPDGSVTLYAHNNRILVRRGQEVAQGQQISEMGSTGRSTGPHLHFEVHPNGRGPVNPIAYLPPRSSARR